MSRIDKIKEFEEFYRKAKRIFENFAEHDKWCELFKNQYSFYVVPGGRYGGNNKKIVEIFFGNRPIDSEEVIDQHQGLKKELITESGATLYYQRTVTGSVICILYPARTKSFNPPEDGISLDFIPRASKLTKRRLKRHWDYFIAYMDVTSIEDISTFKHKIYVWYLRTFKKTFLNGKIKQRKITLFISTIIKYALTVGLSGSLLFIISLVANEPNTANNKIFEELRIINNNISLIVEENRKYNNEILKILKTAKIGDDDIKKIISIFENINHELKKINLTLRNSKYNLNKKEKNLKISTDNLKDK